MEIYARRIVGYDPRCGVPKPDPEFIKVTMTIAVRNEQANQAVADTQDSVNVYVEGAETLDGGRWVVE